MMRNRFLSNASAPQTLTVIDPKLARLRDHSAGSPDGKTIFVANYLSNSLEIVDAEHLPVKPATTSGENPK